MKVGTSSVHLHFVSLKIVDFCKKDLTTSLDAPQTQMYKGIEGSEVCARGLTYTSLETSLKKKASDVSTLKQRRTKGNDTPWEGGRYAVVFAA